MILDGHTLLLRLEHLLKYLLESRILMRLIFIVH